MMEDNINTAMRKGYFQQVRLLARQGVDVNVRDDAGRTPLMNCSLVDDERWAVGLARTLLEHGARSTPRDRFGLTALHHAVVRRRRALVAVLLAAGDFDVHAVDRRGNASLHYAAATGDAVVTGALLAAYRRYGHRVDAANRAAQTALEFAYRNEHVDCAAMIRDTGEAIRADKAATKATAAAAGETTAAELSDGTSLRTSRLNSDGHTTRTRFSVPSDNPVETSGDENSPLQKSSGRIPRVESTPSGLGMFVKENDDNDDDEASGNSCQPRPKTAADAARTCSSPAVPAAALAMTATSVRQQRADRRPRNIVRHQLQSAISARPTIAVRRTRQMMHSGGGDASVSPGGDDSPPAGTTVTTDRRPTSALPLISSPPDWNVDELIPSAVINVRLLHPAPASDPHSRPLNKILRQSAAQFFVEPDPDGKPLENGAGASKCDWRAKIARLYVDYDYQFTQTYRTPAAAPAAASADNGTALDATGATMTSGCDGTQRSARKTSGFRGNDLAAQSATSRKKSVQTQSSVSASSSTAVVGSSSSAAPPALRRGTSVAHAVSSLLGDGDNTRAARRRTSHNRE